MMLNGGGLKNQRIIHENATSERGNDVGNDCINKVINIRYKANITLDKYNMVREKNKN